MHGSSPVAGSPTEVQARSALRRQGTLKRQSTLSALQGGGSPAAVRAPSLGEWGKAGEWAASELAVALKVVHAESVVGAAVASASTQLYDQRAASYPVLQLVGGDPSARPRSVVGAAVLNSDQSVHAVLQLVNKRGRFSNEDWQAIDAFGEQDASALSLFAALATMALDAAFARGGGGAGEEEGKSLEAPTSGSDRASLHVSTPPSSAAIASTTATAMDEEGEGEEKEAAVKWELVDGAAEEEAAELEEGLPSGEGATSVPSLDQLIGGAASDESEQSDHE
ncbi:hypothetical protein T492DRAFT_842752 [Pavlovales sp. CCMP2436]|nr:hypothetical protein T492DRAFT_842752 [Pavlovales sp. CCMP2436]